MSKKQKRKIAKLRRVVEWQRASLRVAERNVDDAKKAAAEAVERQLRETKKWKAQCLHWQGIAAQNLEGQRWVPLKVEEPWRPPTPAAKQRRRFWFHG